MINLDKIKKQLEERQQALHQKLERIMDNVRSPLAADSEEQVVVRENQEVIDDLGNMTRKEISEIASALARIESGDYGICVDCGVEIPEERLEVKPFARRCIKCEENYEAKG
jgi:RNA polymerase-binding protein DksA